ncbi:MAG: hypothetical protein J1E64_11025 [Acetatifactor sp.]|nr:hypothetical protein [Acetatifactor sp.]
MTGLFLKILNMSISASWLVLAVLVLRLVLKKAPKWVNVLLWGIVAVRLLCPFSIESAMSLIPSAETVSPEIMMDAEPTIQTGIPIINNTINPVISESVAPAPTASANPLQIWIPILTCIWMTGVMVLLVYTAVSYLRLRRKVDTAVLLRDNIFQSENVGSPFVLGIIRPKIYLPFQMDDHDLEQVVSHEQAHLQRKDHWWKPLGFLLLTIHWFNPLMWLTYVLLCRDIEFACDEKVIRELGNEQRADYSQALLACSVNRRMIAACPLSFGEVGVKERVKSVLNYKRPAFWIIVAAVIVCIIVAACFLTDPVKQYDTLVWAQELSTDDVLSADLVVFPQSTDKQFKSLSEDDISAMVSLINQSKGKYLAEHENLNGGSIFFYITLKDGTTHDVGNIGNTYLFIDGDYFEAKYKWLSSWDDDFGEGNALLPADYFSTQPPSDDEIEPMQDGVQLIWEDADLDHDGEPESIRVRETAAGELYELEVVKQDGTVLWSTEAGLPHVGWNTILLYQEDGKDYLIQYLPTMYQGFGNYTLTQFSLEGGQLSEDNSWTADFESSGQMNSKMRAFAERANEFMKKGTLLLSTEQGELVIGPKAATEVPQLYPCSFYLDEDPAAMGGFAESGEDWFEGEQPLEFLFASGAGGWGTSLTLYPDGHFEGVYVDGEAIAAPAYPRGTSYICNFSGRFSGITQISGYAYSMQLEELSYESEVDKEWIEDQVRYIGSEAYGVAGGEEFILYLPDTPAEGLNEDFLDWWPDVYLWRQGSVKILSAYGLYNVNTGQGFFTSW